MTDALTRRCLGRAAPPWGKAERLITPHGGGFKRRKQRAAGGRSGSTNYCLAAGAIDGALRRDNITEEEAVGSYVGSFVISSWRRTAVLTAFAVHACIWLVAPTPLDGSFSSRRECPLLALSPQPAGSQQAAAAGPHHRLCRRATAPRWQSATFESQLLQCPSKPPSFSPSRPLQQLKSCLEALSP